MEQANLPHLPDTLLFLVVAGVLVPLLREFRVHSVLGFLVAGVLIGPNGLGALSYRWPALEIVSIEDLDGVGAIGEVGVLFLMFTIGLELSVARLWAMKRWVFGAGLAQMAGCALIIGALAWWFGNAVGSAAVLGLALGFSSTAVVMQLLIARGELGTPVGRAVFSLLLFQDLAVVPTLILVETLQSHEGLALVAAMGLALLKGAIALALIFWLGRVAVRPLFRRLAAQREPDTFTALMLLAALGIASLTSMAGLSMALGAFLAGLVLSETEYRHELEMAIEPFRGLLMGLFFLSVGMGIDVREVLSEPIWLPLSVLGLLTIKAIISGAVLWRAGLTPARALEGGMLLGQGGEFAFVVLGAAIAGKLIPEDVGRFMLLTVGLSMLLTPGVSRLARWGRRKWGEDSAATSAADDALTAQLPSGEGRTIVIGFGRVGQKVAQTLTAQQLPYIAIETSAERVAHFHGQGMPVFVGDARRPEILRHISLPQAVLVLVTMDDPEAALHVVKAVRRSATQVPILARASDAEHAAALLDAGATYVVEETLEASLCMARVALTTLDMPEDVVDTLLEQERARPLGA